MVDSETLLNNYKSAVDAVHLADDALRQKYQVPFDTALSSGDFRVAAQIVLSLPDGSRVRKDFADVLYASIGRITNHKVTIL